jgi:hypothetical protein
MKTFFLAMLCSVLFGCSKSDNAGEKPPEIHNERFSIPQYEKPKEPSKSKY